MHTLFSNLLEGTGLAWHTEDDVLHLQAHEAASGVGEPTGDSSPLGAFVTDELIAGGFLKQLLQPFLEDIMTAQQTSQGGHARLRTEASRLQSFVQQAFGWTVGVEELTPAAAGSAPRPDEEADDEAPVVVDLNESYAL